MSRIFVSYSRKNKDFCRQLTDELQKRDIDFWVDWNDIDPTVKWKDAIGNGIEDADNFLAIVTPDWIVSPICLEELNIAVKNGKRLIPVVPCELKWDDVPAVLGDLNFIFFTEAYDFNQQFYTLLTALNTDYEWVNRHTRLQAKALEWERNNKENGFLLHGKELEEAEVQISINANKVPYSTDLQRDYVLKSRQAATRQRRITNAVVAFVIVMLTGITAYLGIPRIQEVLARNEARGELIRIPAGTMKFGTEVEYELVLGAVPLQEIYVPEFYIGTHEVTNTQYKLCVTHGDCTVPLEQTRYNIPEMGNHPVVYVTLFQAHTFCQWVGQRLLTEVEWERAVRGTDGRQWPWETDEPPLPHLVNMPAPETSDPNEGTQPAISYTPGQSPDGLYNLIGNVWEWTSSYVYEGGEYQAASWSGDPDDYNGTLRYATRGGGWSNNISFVAQSNPNYGTDVRNDLGFRCAADAK